MTDDLDPRTDPGTADDETTRMASRRRPMPRRHRPSRHRPPRPRRRPSRRPTPAAPTSPLTPASRPDGADARLRERRRVGDRRRRSSSPARTPPRRRSRLRWAAAIAVVALVVGASAAAAALLTGSSSTATVLGYVPEHTIVYGEVRLDLPGDQKQAVGAFLSKFPGFADQASLDTKLDEVLDDLIRDASNGEQTYTGNIKSWFDGELAFSVGPLPPASIAVQGRRVGAWARSAPSALLSVKDPTAAEAWFDAAFKKAGANDHDRDLQRHDHHGLRRGRRGHDRLRADRRQGRRLRRPGLGQGRHRHQGRRRLRQGARPQGRARLLERRPRRVHVPGPAPAARLVDRRVEGDVRTWVAAPSPPRPSATRS